MNRTIKTPKKRKSDIINTARHLFLTKKKDVTIQDVMDHLDIAKGTVYHYFKSKDELFDAVIQSIADKNIQYMQDLMDNAEGTALDKMKMLIEASSISDENEAIIHDLHQANNAGIHIKLLATILIKQASLYEKLIEQGCKEGVFQTDNSLECAEFILSGVQFLTDFGIYPWKKEDLIRRAEAFPRLIEQLLQAPLGSFYFISEHLKKAIKKLGSKSHV